jgi:hypothetical protein
MLDVKKEWVCRRCDGAGTVVLYVVNGRSVVYTCENCRGYGVVYPRPPLRPLRSQQRLPLNCRHAGRPLLSCAIVPPPQPHRTLACIIIIERAWAGRGGDPSQHAT